MIRSPETLRINLVDILGAGRTGREPSAFGYHFQSADGSTVARRYSEDSLDFFACQLAELDLLGRELRHQFLLIRSG